MNLLFSEFADMARIASWCKSSPACMVGQSGLISAFPVAALSEYDRDAKAQSCRIGELNRFTKLCGKVVATGTVAFHDHDPELMWVKIAIPPKEKCPIELGVLIPIFIIVVIGLFDVSIDGGFVTLK